MTEAELLKLIHGGENIRVEFKKSVNEITKDVYDTVCSFSNRDGGIIFLGVKDSGEVLGIAPDAVDRMKKDFVISINNGQKNQSAALLTAGSIPCGWAYDSGHSSPNQQSGVSPPGTHF